MRPARPSCVPTTRFRLDGCSSAAVSGRRRGQASGERVPRPLGGDRALSPPREGAEAAARAGLLSARHVHARRRLRARLGSLRIGKRLAKTTSVFRPPTPLPTTPAASVVTAAPTANISRNCAASTLLLLHFTEIC
uniref:Uncharacterized protein n=1 Tax=Plectus sambesii TaxID=2011161 RepID=A0A914VWI6_9BILA